MLRAIQVGLNTSDLAGSLRLYSEAFGFQNAGSQGLWGSTIGVQGLPFDGRALLWWMVGRQAFFQLELFHHSVPSQRPLRADWRPNDHGWSHLGISVANFDNCFATLAHHGIFAITDPVRHLGLRRAAIRDPFVGVIIEIIERQAVEGDVAEGPAIVYARSSVADLSSAHTFYTEVVGLEVAEADILHVPAHESLWGMSGAHRTMFVVRAGEVYLEIVQYYDPAGRPRPLDYRTSDQGIVNIALGSREKEPVALVFERMRVAGYEPPQLINTKDVIAGYIIDAERELEFAAVPESYDAAFGFVAASPFMS